MRNRMRVVAIVAAGLLGSALGACGSGQDALTSQVVPAVPGVNIDAEDDSILIRNAAVPYQPAGYRRGGRAPIEMWIVNMTQDPVRLVSASSDLAAAVETDGVVDLAPGQLTAVTLQLTRLTQPVNATSRIPLELRFDNSVQLFMQVPVAPPAENEERVPMELEDEEH